MSYDIDLHNKPGNGGYLLFHRKSQNDAAYVSACHPPHPIYHSISRVDVMSDHSQHAISLDEEGPKTYCF